MPGQEPLSINTLTTPLGKKKAYIRIWITLNYRCQNISMVKIKLYFLLMSYFCLFINVLILPKNFKKPDMTITHLTFKWYLTKGNWGNFFFNFLFYLFSLFLPSLSFLSQKSNLRCYFLAFWWLLRQGSFASCCHVSNISQVELWRNFSWDWGWFSKLFVYFFQNSIIIFDQMGLLMNIINFLLLNMRHSNFDFFVKLSHQTSLLLCFFCPFLNLSL